MAITPDAVPKLIKKGFAVRIESGAGAAAGYADDDYTAAGASLVSREDALSAPVVVKVAPPSEEEVGLLAEGTFLAAVLQSADNEPLMQKLAERGVAALALEKIPRITRAQKMDVLSSMANIAGYRAIIEAANALQGFLGAQVTAAGTTPPAKVLIIGAGVAGLAAVAAARALGAEVRAFDVRPATKEQVESLGATFLQVELDESGEGEGGYAKTMSKEFIDAEMALFRAQAKEVRVVVTTALIPGKKAPTLWTKDMVEAMAPGSVVVDLAAAAGGNCEVTVPHEATVHHGVHVLGYTDLTSRMAHTASRFFAGNVVALLDEMVGDDGFHVDLEDEVVRAALQTHAGERLPEPERKPAPPKPKASRRPPPDVEQAKKSPTKKQDSGRFWGTTGGGLLALVGLLFLGRFAPDAFVQHFTVFILACFVGWQVVWSVTPALHTPLMSVTNAISGIIVVGGMLQAGRGGIDLATVLGAVAVLFAAINIAGGFFVTQRMLRMFRKDDS